MSTPQQLARLFESQPRSHRLALAEQPLDRLLCAKSSLFRRSREMFLKQGGKFYPEFVSSPRTLSSDVLLSDRINYTPIESELQWSVSDPIERRNPAHFRAIRTYVLSSFHEQNHRILWKFLPPAPRERAAARRYLSFAEALVVASDMALGDQLGRLAPVLYETGVIYDPGSTFLARARPSRRRYRNYLQAAVFATYLNMELYSPKEIPGVTARLFPGPDSLASARRALLLGRDFVEKTAPFWERKNHREVVRRLGGANPLVLPPNPLENHLQYLWAEKWFERLGL